MEKTQTERAIGLLKRAILHGEVPPGERLHIQDLADRYSIGVTPVREALSRLASLGLVVAYGQRGFRAASSSLEDFSDIVRTRTLIETEALRLSLLRGGEDWERAIAEAFSELKTHLQGLPESFDEGDGVLDDLHKRYHLALISACGSDRMLRYCSTLYDEAYRYRQIFMTQPRTRSVFLAEHATLTKHVLSRVEDRAVAFLTLHLDAALTALVDLKQLPDREPGSPPQLPAGQNI